MNAITRTTPNTGSAGRNVALYTSRPELRLHGVRAVSELRQHLKTLYMGGGRKARVSEAVVDDDSDYQVYAEIAVDTSKDRLGLQDCLGVASIAMRLNEAGEVCASRLLIESSDRTGFKLEGVRAGSYGLPHLDHALTRLAQHYAA